MNVALIDDGVEINNLTSKYVKEFLEVYDSNEIVKQVSKVEFCSHGTICASIIRKIALNSNIYSLKILDSHSLSSGVDKLEAAFKWCLEHNINIINLSLGTINSKEFIKIEKWIRCLGEKNILVVAAINNNNTYTIPASLPMVVGVSSSKLSDGYRFLERSNMGIDIYAPSNHLITLSNGREFETPFCNSFAAPAVTGQICKICKADFIDELKNKYFFSSLINMINQKRENLKQNFRFSMVEYKFDYENLSYNKLTKKEEVPIISIRCSEEDLNIFNSLFYEDNIFPVKVQGIDLVKARDKFNLKTVRKIKEQMGCDIIIIHNYDSNLGKEDLFIECLEHKFKLYYSKLFEKVIYEYNDIKNLYNEMLILLE